MTARKKVRTSTARADVAVQPSRSQRGTVAAVCAALILLTVVTYAPVWRFDFVALDDPQYVYDNPALKAGLTPATIGWAFTTGLEANWHPLTWISHALDVQLFGMAAGWHHVTNLVLHLASTLLLFGVMRMLTGSMFRSAFVAAIFAVHPLHVESVAWVAERKDVLSALFFMLTTGAYVRYVRQPGTGRYLLVALCLTLGLMAKPMLVTLPFVLLLLDYWPLDRFRRGFRALVIEKLPLLAIVAASSVATFLAQRHGGAVKSLTQMPVAMRAQNAVVSYLDYLVQTFWPTRMSVFYPFPNTLPVSRVALSAAVLLAITGAVWAVRRRAPYALVGWLWFGGMIVPVTGVLQVGAQARADRFMYLPMIGLTIAVAWGAVALARTAAGRRVVAVVGVAAVAACAVVAHAQVQYWRETVGLWSHAAEVTESPNNFGLYFSIAEYLRLNRRPAESIPHYEAAIARNPAYVQAHQGLVRALMDTKQPDRAIGALENLVRSKPDDGDARLMLGSLLLDLGRGPEAERELTEAIRLRPGNADAHWRLALVLASAGRLVDALPEFADAVRLDPSSAPMRNDYGWALAQHGQVAAGLEQIGQAVTIQPDLVDAHLNMGRILAAQGKNAEALSHLTEAVRLEPNFVDARLTLAVTLIRAGRTDDGVRELREVLARDPQNETARRALAAIGR
jgi:tetratricopeptide (TPR) repeat protein